MLVITTIMAASIACVPFFVAPIEGVMVAFDVITVVTIIAIAGLCASFPK